MQRSNTTTDPNTDETLSKLIWIESTLKENARRVPTMAVYMNATESPGPRDVGEIDSATGGSENTSRKSTAAGQPRKNSHGGPPSMAADAIETIPRIEANTAQLIAVLERIRDDAPDGHELRANAADLVDRMHGFLEDLRKPDGRLEALLTEYDRYRKAYGRLQRRASEASEDKGRKPPETTIKRDAKTTQTPEDCCDKIGDDDDDGNDGDDANGNGLYPCPGLLDLTKENVSEGSVHVVTRLSESGSKIGEIPDDPTDVDGDRLSQRIKNIVCCFLPFCCMVSIRE